MAAHTPSRARDRFVAVAALVAIVVGVLVLVGWTAGVGALKSVVPDFATMKANTAVLFVLAGLSLWTLPKSRSAPGAPRVVGAVCGIGVAAGAVLTLVQYAGALDFGIDQLLFPDPLSPSFPGRMVPATGIMFSLLAAGLLLLHAGRAPVAAQATAVLALLLAALCCLGYLYGAAELHSFGPFGSVAVHTALTFLALTLGALAACPNTGPIGFLAGDGPGSELARRLLPAVVVIPIAAGTVRLAGQRAGWYGTEFGVALTALSSVVIFAGVVYWSAARVQRSEDRRRASERIYRAIGESINYGVWVCDPDGRNTYASPSFLDLVGITQQECSDFGWGDTLHPDDTARTIAAWKECVRVRGRWHTEHRFRGKDGQWHPVLAVGTPVFDEQQNLICWAGINLDISPLKRAEGDLRELNATLEQRVAERTRALRESEERLKLALVNARQGLWDWDVPSGGVYYDDAWERLFGYAPGEVPHRIEVWQNSIHPDDLPAVLAKLQAHLASDPEPYEVEYRARTKSGAWMWVNARGRVQERAADGSPLRMSGTIQDVTTRKRAEEALRASEERYRAVVEDQTEAVSRLRADGTYIFVNEVFCHTFGGSPAERLGTKWTPIVYPDDVPRIEAALATMSADNPIVPIENRVFDAAGRVRWMEFVNRGFFGPGGELLEIQSVGRDATARKAAEAALRASEERYRSVVDSLAEGIVVQDAEGRIVAFNERAVQILGLTRDQITGRTSMDPLWATVREDGSPLPGAEHPATVVLRTGRPVFNTIMGVGISSGERTWLTVNAVPIPHAGTGEAAVVSSFHDITASRRMDEQLRASLAEKDVMLREIHHRVKNNLQIVSALLDLQSRHTKDRAVVAMFRESRERVRSMALIHERLYRSRDMARIDFAEYARQLTRDLFRNYNVSGGVRLELDVTVPALTLDTAIPCGLLLNELLSNCLKHAFPDARAGCVRVTFGRDADGTNVLTVADDGVGFPAGADLRTATSFGMQLVGTLVEQLGGAIDLRRTGGTTISVRFPTKN